MVRMGYEYEAMKATYLKKTDQTQFNKFNPTRSTITYLPKLHLPLPFWQSNSLDHILQATDNQLLLSCRNSSQVGEKKRQQNSLHNFNHYTWGEIRGNRLFYSSQLRYELNNYISLRKELRELQFRSAVFTRPRTTQTSLGTSIYKLILFIGHFQLFLSEHRNESTAASDVD